MEKTALTDVKLRWQEAKKEGIGEKEFEEFVNSIKNLDRRNIFEMAFLLWRDSDYRLETFKMVAIKRGIEIVKEGDTVSSEVKYLRREVMWYFN